MCVFWPIFPLSLSCRIYLPQLISHFLIMISTYDDEEEDKTRVFNLTSNVSSLIALVAHILSIPLLTTALPSFGMRRAIPVHTSVPQVYDRFWRL